MCESFSSFSGEIVTAFLVVLWAGVVWVYVPVLGGVGLSFVLVVACLSVLGGIQDVVWEVWAILGVTYIGGVVVLVLYVSSGDVLVMEGFGAVVVILGVLLYGCNSGSQVSGVSEIFSKGVMADLAVLGGVLLWVMVLLGVFFGANGAAYGAIRSLYLLYWNCLFQLKTSVLMGGVWVITVMVMVEGVMTLGV